MERTYSKKVIELADQLYEAENSQVSMRPLRELYPEISIPDAYHVQLYNIDRQVQQGKEIVGKKIGLTSKPMQELAGVDEPDYGHLLENMVIAQENPVIPMAEVLWPRVEGELAFILKEDLTGPHVTVEKVLAATEFIIPAIEIVDSRIENWDIKIEDTVGDNGSSAYYILGENRLRPDEIDRIGIEMELYQNGELINKGTGADVLGDPAYCVAWLANKLYEYDISLKKGEVILSGALTRALDAKAGDTFTCRFTEGLGEVTINFE